MNTPFRLVDEQVARNPVARAVSKRNLQSAIRDFQLRLHLMRDGDDASGDCEAAIRSLGVCLLALDIIQRSDDPAYRVMRGAISALQQCVKRGYRWRSMDAVAVDQGMQCVADIYPQLPADVMQRAWKEAREIEARVVSMLRVPEPA